MHWFHVLFAAPFSGFREKLAAPKGLLTPQRETQTLHVSDINGWALYDTLDNRFKGRFHVEVDDQSYRIWAPEPLTNVGSLKQASIGYPATLNLTMTQDEIGDCRI